MAAPPPPSRPMSLESLPYDIQRLILSRIPCGVDRGRMCLVWRNLVRGHQHQPPLPWLLLPAAYPEGSTRLACAVCDSRVHHYLTVSPLGARCFGSHDGAWLFLHYRGREPRGSNHALNVRTGHAERLPANLLGRDAVYVGNVVILAAALSASPDDASCIGAAIVEAPLRGQAPNAVPVQRLCVALWRKGWAWAHELAPPEENDAALHVDDVVYHNGAFHILTQGNHILVCKPTIEHQNPSGLSVNWETRRFQFHGSDNQFARARYLVKSRGELLLVLRFTPQPNQPTSMFKVFREADASEWREMDTLGGRMLFVGHGCSRSYEVDQHPGLKDGVYFLDDGEFYDADVIFGVGDVRQYPCSDNVKWYVQRCFPRPDLSDHSVPVWLLP